MCLGGRSAGMPARNGCMRLRWSSLSSASVLLPLPLGSDGRGGVCIPFATPRLSPDAHNELSAPPPPSSFDRGPLIVIEVRSAGCSVVSAWLLSLHLETVPVSRSCRRGGIPRGNAGDAVSGTSTRSGQAEPPLRMPSSSPGPHPSADAGMWVTGRDANNSHYSLLVLCGVF